MVQGQEYIPINAQGLCLYSENQGRKYNVPFDSLIYFYDELAPDFATIGNVAKIEIIIFNCAYSTQNSFNEWY